MEGIYNTVLIKDVIQRKKITDAALLESLSQYLADNISNPVTSTGIANYLTSSGKKRLQRQSTATLKRCQMLF